MISLVPEGGAKAGPSMRMEEVFAPGGAALGGEQL
jgi:hypothetical protein